MNLLIEDTDQEAFGTLYDDRPAALGPFVAGGSEPLTLTRLKRIRLPYDGKEFEPQAFSTWTVRAALGGGFILPLTGNWPITFTDSDDAAHSSDWVIPAQPTEADIQNTLNGLAAVSAIGGVTVQGRNGFFQITFNEAGAQNLLAGNAARLSPLSLLNFSRAVTGDDSTQEVQILQIAQNTGAIVSLTADSVVTTITQSNIVVGDGTHNAVIRVTLPSTRYGGSWSLTKGATIVPGLGWGDNAAQLQQALQTALGSGTVLVSQYSVDAYDLTFAGTLALTAITISLSGAGLLVPETQSGELDLTSVGTYLLFGTKDEVIAKLEIEGTPAGGTMRKIFQADVQLRRPVVTTGSVTTGGGQSLEDYSGTETDAAVSTAGTTTLSPTKRFFQWFAAFTVGAGSLSTYTRTIVLDRTNAIAGAIFRVELNIAASANPTVVIRDNSVSGTILDTIPGDSDNALKYVLEAEYRSGAWKFVRGTIQT